MFDDNDERFINRFLMHVRKLQDNMIYLEKRLDIYDFLDIKDFELIDRSMKHDLDKLENNLIQHYLKINNYYYCKRHNIPCKKVVEDIAKTREVHHNTQRHHFYFNKMDFNIIDICEMCCDVDSVYSLSDNNDEKNNKTYFINYMLPHYSKLLPIKDLCLKIFDILEYKNDELKNIKKSEAIDSYINYVRKFQDCMIKLEKHRNNLFFNVDKWEITKVALNYNKNDFLNFSKIGDNYFEYNKRIINDNIDNCCLVCSCYSYFKDDCYKHIDIDERVQNILDIIRM